MQIEHDDARVVTEHSERDAELLAGVGRGSHAALGALYDRYGPGAYRLALTFTGRAADAEAVVQEAFMSVWRTQAKCLEATSLPLWLVGFVRDRSLRAAPGHEVAKQGWMSGRRPLGRALKGVD